MVKNYTNWIFLAVLVVAFNFSYSQSNHTVTFTGNASDFYGVEKIKGSSDIDYYVTFDENYIYFGAFSTVTYNSNAQFTIYIDVDPQPIINTGNGTTMGVLADNKTPMLPFNADHRFSITKVNGGQSFHHKYEDAAWVNQSPGTFSNFVQHATNHSLEIAIDKSKIDNTNGIYFSMFMSRPGPAPSGSLYGVSDIDYPIKFSGDTSTGYFGGIGLNAEGVSPTQFTNTPILHTLTNSDPTSGGKYAHIEIKDGYYTAPGNIEIVAGGTANIAPGSALTVDSTFTNNGLVTLQSTSTSFSSLIARTVDGGGITKYNRHVNRIASVGESDLVSAPLTGQNFADFAAANPNIVNNPNPGRETQKRFGPFNKTTGAYQNYDTAINVDANAILAPGKGYRAASNIVSPSDVGGPFTFTGTVNTGVISTSIKNSSDEFARWNLIGNPYPSYIKISQLISENLDQFDSNYVGIYGYNGAGNNEWVKINLTNHGSRLMAPGQGFFVLSRNDGGTITFNPAIRSVGNANDFIPSRSAMVEDLAGIVLNISSGTQSYPTEIYFSDEGTLDHDIGYDTGLIGSPNLSIYSKLVEDKDNRNIQLAIQTLPYSILATEVIVPIGIKATQGQQLTISRMDSPYADPIPTAIDVYFEDNVANTSTLLKNNDYIFTPSNNLSGMGRFSLRFTNNPLSVKDSNFEELRVYSPLNTRTLIVKGYVNQDTNLEIFDLNGRLIQTASVKSNQAVNRFELATLSSGIYIVKLKNKTQSKIKKIQVNR